MSNAVFVYNELFSKPFVSHRSNGRYGENENDELIFLKSIGQELSNEVLDEHIFCMTPRNICAKN